MAKTGPQYSGWEITEQSLCIYNETLWEIILLSAKIWCRGSDYMISWLHDMSLISVCDGRRQTFTTSETPHKRPNTDTSVSGFLFIMYDVLVGDTDEQEHTAANTEKCCCSCYEVELWSVCVCVKLYGAMTPTPLLFWCAHERRQCDNQERTEISTELANHLL